MLPPQPPELIPPSHTEWRTALAGQFEAEAPTLCSHLTGRFDGMGEGRQGKGGGVAGVGGAEFPLQILG